jgi:hypothetical protein
LGRDAKASFVVDDHNFVNVFDASDHGVRDEIRRWKQQTAEVFMPLAHPPGEAQFDFGERDRK